MLLDITAVHGFPQGQDLVHNGHFVHGFEPLEVLFKDTVSPQFPQCGIKTSHADPLLGLVDYLEAGYNVEVVLPELSEGEVC